MPIASANNDTNAVYVAVDGSDTGDGSFDNPYCNITKALGEDSDTIILKNGTYSQSNININKSVSIFGLDDAVINGGGKWILNVSNPQSTVNLVNLSFINAYSEGIGAAIVNNANLTVDGVKFINNSAYSAPAIDNSANLLVINSCFEANDAYGKDGGAISNVANMTVINSRFINNTALRNGGAIKSQISKLTIINSSFAGNDAFGSDNYGGAVYIWASKAEIINSTFKSNRGGYGGGVFISGGNLETTALNVSRCVFENNYARSGRDLEIDDGICNVNYSKILDGAGVLKTSQVNLNCNWWGTNNPNFNEITTSPKPDVYATLNLSKSDNKVKTGVYWLGSSDVVSEIPQLFGSIQIDSNKTDNVEFIREYEFNAGENSNVTVILDKEVLSLSSKIQTYLTVDSLEMYYHDGSQLIAFLKDIDDKNLVNQSVEFEINGMKYNRTTDDEGRACIGMNLKSGTYNVSVNFSPQVEKYFGCNATAEVNVLPTVNGSDVIKVYKNDTQYFAAFLDFEGKHLAEGSIVSFNINGVFYNRTVSENGLAKLNINLVGGEYVITAINTVTGEKCANNITVLSRICENSDIVKYYKNETQYTVKVIGDDGNAVGAGENVTFNINGVFYTRQTDENGVAKLNINLMPGDYVITAEYNGCRVSNDIKVLSVLSAKDISMSYLDGTKFNAVLLNGQGNLFGGQDVTFNINGVFYTRLTDANGTASLNINLMGGEYIITSSYNGCSISNKITIH